MNWQLYMKKYYDKTYNVCIYLFNCFYLQSMLNNTISKFYQRRKKCHEIPMIRRISIAITLQT